MTVWLVGAGPGDPGLITARGLELVRRCDALVYDRLVAPELVAEAPADALTISRDGLDQERINALLIDLAAQGLEVVRLKGGDPFVFGRGGEEALALADADVPFEVVPGVSALAAVPAAAGIPLTHRGVSAQVRVVSGRSADGEVELEPAVAGETLVLFMALNELGSLCERLVALGQGHDLDGGRLPRPPLRSVRHSANAPSGSSSAHTMAPVQPSAGSACP